MMRLTLILAALACAGCAKEPTEGWPAAVSIDWDGRQGVCTLSVSERVYRCSYAPPARQFYYSTKPVSDKPMQRLPRGLQTLPTATPAEIDKAK